MNGQLSNKKGYFYKISYLGWVGIVIILTIISLAVGVFDLSNNPLSYTIFWSVRVPRTFALLLTAMAMGISGLVIQQLTNNRFVEPTTASTSQWASLGLICAYLFIPAPSMMVRISFAIIFAFVGTLVFLRLSHHMQLKNPILIPLIGMMLGAVISALTTYISLSFNMSQILENWFIASFAPIQQGRYEYLWFILLFAGIIYGFARHLAVISMGEDFAMNLGVPYKKFLIFGTFLIAIITGIVSVVVGNIPFIGLIVPNIISDYFGDNIKSNLPWVCVVSMALLTACDILSRSWIAPFEMPVSLILNILGGVIFIRLLLKTDRR